MINSSSTNPDEFATWINVSADCAGTCAEPVMVVEFAMCNCPPTALIVSFSNTVVDNVPRILASSTSKNELTEPSDNALAPKKNPLTLDA